MVSWERLVGASTSLWRLIQAVAVSVVRLFLLLRLLQGADHHSLWNPSPAEGQQEVSGIRLLQRKLLFPVLFEKTTRLPD